VNLSAAIEKLTWTKGHFVQMLRFIKIRIGVPIVKIFLLYSCLLWGSYARINTCEI
jgi:hypothetical protein